MGAVYKYFVHHDERRRNSYEVLLTIGFTTGSSFSTFSTRSVVPKRTAPARVFMNASSRKLVS